MPRATKEELEWAYALTREKFLVRMNKLSPIRAADWNRYASLLISVLPVIRDVKAILLNKIPAYSSEVARYDTSFLGTDVIRFVFYWIMNAISFSKRKI